ncbi:MAG: KEOPS complex subunit Cgi121 [Candidatus Bathyarchaeota archaeon]|nr:KEOPS complex subunit Cgi121 [Candidatus Bathyarchaeota archaeon]
MVRTSTIKGSDKAVSIGGFRGVTVNDVDELLSSLSRATSPAVFQIFDATRIAGWRHLYMAAVNAVAAFESGTTISRGLGIEALLYTSCQDQISRALDVVGVSPGTANLALIILRDGPGEAEAAFEKAADILGEADDSVLGLDETKFREIAEVFGVSENALEAVGGERDKALTSLLVEKGALLPLRR